LQYRIFNAEVGDVYRPDCALTLWMMKVLI
jgi:hypothetical protein